MGLMAIMCVCVLVCCGGCGRLFDLRLAFLVWERSE